MHSEDARAASIYSSKHPSRNRSCFQTAMPRQTSLRSLIISNVPETWSASFLAEKFEGYDLDVVSCSLVRTTAVVVFPDARCANHAQYLCDGVPVENNVIEASLSNSDAEVALTICNAVTGAKMAILRVLNVQTIWSLKVDVAECVGIHPCEQHLLVRDDVLDDAALVCDALEDWTDEPEVSLLQVQRHSIHMWTIPLGFDVDDILEAFEWTKDVGLPLSCTLEDGVATLTFSQTEEAVRAVEIWDHCCWLHCTIRVALV